jgi:hypothetical protein
MDSDAVSDVLSCEVGFYFCFNTKVSGLNSLTHLERTPIILWFVVRCGSKNGHQKNMFFKEIGLRAQKYDPFKGLLGNTIEGA